MVLRPKYFSCLLFALPILISEYLNGTIFLCKVFRFHPYIIIVKYEYILMLVHSSSLRPLMGICNSDALKKDLQSLCFLTPLMQKYEIANDKAIFILGIIWYDYLNCFKYSISFLFLITRPKVHTYCLKI